MGKHKYAIGVDFGTESGRAVLVDVTSGKELATAVYEYSHGVIDEVLPGEGKPVRLEPDWALQDPEDYLRTFKRTVPAVLRQSDVDPVDVIGLGIDFTACTMLPTLADGTPLCVLPEYRRNPHAWVKLWKHHAAQPEADKINATARTMGEAWLDRYGGKISSEWFFSKTLQILDEAPEIYAAADRLLEAADWVVWQLTGVETRNSCTAGYKAMWSKREGFPRDAYFAALDPRLEHVIDEKMSRTICPIGERAGSLTPQAAKWMGLKPGTAVAVANVDAHVSVPAATVIGPGRMVAIMGTSICHMVLGDKERLVRGICGYVEDGIIPGLFGFEAGQSGVGDIFAWLVDNAVPPEYHAAANKRKMDLHKLLEYEAAKLKPGESGLLALDWWNGNRSVLVDVDLTGLLLGATLATKAPEIYRALIEATAFGTRVIVEAFDTNGVPVNEIVTCGGLPEKNRLLMQIYAGRPPRSARRCSGRWRRARLRAATTLSSTPRRRWRG
ncbi:MAG: L-ribulokinase [Anaerolineales bacterium]|nr:L-ribulokinase [Anaerolineales bacterium]